MNSKVYVQRHHRNIDVFFMWDALCAGLTDYMNALEARWIMGGSLKLITNRPCFTSANIYSVS